MNTTKKFTVFAGVNGAGKSTLFYAENNRDLGIRLNSDEILQSLGLNWQDPNAQLLAGKKLLELQKNCLENQISFNRETTLCGNNIFSTIKQAKNLGYTIHLRYVGVANTQIAKTRVAQRVARGGHGIPDETLDRRFSLSKENLLKVLPLCDSVVIYDNTNVMTCVASMQNGQIKYVCHVPWVDDLFKLL